MDGQSLQSMWESGSPFLAQMGVQSFNQDQAKAQQALLAARGQEQRAQAMQPLEEAHKQATTGYNQALTNQLTDKMATQPPAADRMALAMSEYRKKMGDAQAKEEDTKMQRRMQYAEMAAKNNGVLPLEYMNSLPADERAFYANPQATQRTQALTKAWYDSHPKTLENRAKQANDLERARIAAGPGYARAAGAASTKGKPPGSPSALMTHYTMKANEEEEGSPEWTKYMALANNEWQKLQALKAQAAEAGLTGKLDLPATQATGAPVVRGAPTPSAMPGAGGKPKPGSSPDNPIILK